MVNEAPPAQGASAIASMSPLAACIDGNRAFAHVAQVTTFVPRHAGTQGLEKTRQYIVESLVKMGFSPLRQRFLASTPHPELKTVEFENISVIIPGASKTSKRVLISGHFDGKIIEEGIFYGANDGGSSTAVLLEMARCLKAFPAQQSVELVFFDGEEALVKWSDSDSLYGSKHFVLQLAQKNAVDEIAALVNIDMIGDARLAYVRELNSTKWVMNALLAAATRIGKQSLFSGPTMAVGDDHLPFLEMEIPAAVLIDFHYGPGWQSNTYWHTDQDNLEHIDAESMENTGQIVLSALADLAAGPP